MAQLAVWANEYYSRHLMSWLHSGAKNFWEDPGACGKVRLEAVSSRDGEIRTALGYTQRTLMSRTAFMAIKISIRVLGIPNFLEISSLSHQQLVLNTINTTPQS